MNTAVINIKTDPKVKARAKKVAAKLGFSLSALINGYLRQVVKTETIHFSTKEVPSNYPIESIRKSEADIKAGHVISFKTPDEEQKYLDRMIANARKKSTR